MATASSTAAPKVNPSFATGFNEPCPKIIKLKTNVKINNAAIATVFSTVTTTFLDAWSAGISSESLSKNINGKWIAVAATVIGMIGAIVYPMDDITDFLYLIGSVFAPMIAVQIADFFILHQDFSRKSVCIQNMLVWVVGFIAYRWLMGVDTILGNTLPDMVITIILSVIVSLLFGKKND